MSRKKLSILIPAYNEAETIHNILDKVIAVELLNDIEKEIVIVNDFSTDTTKDKVEEYITNHPQVNIRLYNQEKNQGKGAALHKALNWQPATY